MTARLAHSLFVWTCLLLLGAGSFLRPGMVLCISDHGDHGHVSLEANCASACETACLQAGDVRDENLATAVGAHNDCRDVPIELDPTTSTRESKSVPQFDKSETIPVAILEAPIALASSYTPRTRLGESVPRPPAALSRLRVIVLQV